MLIEVTTFRLAPQTDEAMFLAADARAQTDVAYQQPGLVRRTTARGDGGEWLSITGWSGAEAADAAAAAGASSEIGAALLALIDPATVQRRRYTTID